MNRDFFKFISSDLPNIGWYCKKELNKIKNETKKEEGQKDTQIFLAESQRKADRKKCYLQLFHLSYLRMVENQPSFSSFHLMLYDHELRREVLIVTMLLRDIHHFTFLAAKRPKRTSWWSSWSGSICNMVFFIQFIVWR